MSDLSEDLLYSTDDSFDDFGPPDWLEDVKENPGDIVQTLHVHWIVTQRVNNIGSPAEVCKYCDG